MTTKDFQRKRPLAIFLSYFARHKISYIIIVSQCSLCIYTCPFDTERHCDLHEILQRCDVFIRLAGLTFLRCLV